MKTAIIGGGIGGMMTALFLSRQGADVTLYEKEKRLGGRLTFVGNGGYKIDEGPTIVLLPEMFKDLLNEAGVSKDKYELLLCDPLYTIHFQDGISYTKYKDRNRQEEELRRLFPSEVKGFRRFMKEGKQRFEIGKSAFLEKSFVKTMDFWTAGNIRNLLKLKSYLSVSNLMASYFKNEHLRVAYSLQTLYIGGDPFRAPAMYTLIPFSEHEHGVYYLKGGYAGLVDILQEALLENGVKILLESKVERLHTDRYKVTGVETCGSVAGYDSIVYNGDLPLLQQLIDNEKKPRGYTASSGCVLLYFGLDKIYTETQLHQFFMGSNFHGHMEKVFSRKEVPENPAFYTFHPSLIDDTLAPKGHGVLYILIPVPSGTSIDWKQEEVWIDEIIDRLEAEEFPDLRTHITWRKIRTPKEAYDFGLYQGGSFGIAPELRQSGIFRPQAKPLRYENLYAAGASVHPGGGIPIVMQSAKLVCEQIMIDQTVRSEKGDAVGRSV